MCNGDDGPKGGRLSVAFSLCRVKKRKKEQRRETTAKARETKRDGERKEEDDDERTSEGKEEECMSLATGDYAMNANGECEWVCMGAHAPAAGTQERRGSDCRGRMVLSSGAIATVCV